MKRMKRALAAAAVAAVAGAGLTVATSAPASAAPVFTPSSGNDQTLFGASVDVGCPAGTLSATYALEGPGQNFVVDGNGGLGPAPLSGPGAFANASIANLRTANTAFATGPYPQVYDFNLVCSGLPGEIVGDTDGDGNVIVKFGEFTVTGQGITADTWSAAAVVANTNTTTTLAASPTTAEQGSPIALTATVAPAVTAGSVEFFNGSTSLGTDTTAADGFTLSVNSLPVGTNNVTAVYSGASGFNGSTAAPVAVTVTAVAPRPTTTTLVSVTPATGNAFATTEIVCDVQAATGAAAGTLAFRANGSVLGTQPVTGNGPVTFSTNAIGAGTGIAVDCAFTGVAPYQNSASGALTIDRTLVGATDEQTVVVEIPVGAITITTPYTPAAPLNLGTAVLDQSDSTYSASAAFDRVTITDTRSGQLGFTASLVAGPFTSATDSFPGRHAGFENVTAVQVAGNALQASNVATTSTPAFTPGLGAPTVFATYPAGNALGTVEITADFTVDQIPSSVQPGLYTSTVTFTAL
jgi:hypothetical protein